MKTNNKLKFYITTTVPNTLEFFIGQPRIWREFFNVKAISANKERLKKFAEEEGISYKTIEMERNPSPVKDIISLIKFIFCFAKEKPDIVHGGTPKASLLSMIAAWITRRPIRIYFCHGLRYQAYSGKMRKLLMWFEKVSSFCATDVICVSNGIKKGLIDDNLCSKTKARVIGYGSPCGIDLNHYSADDNQSNDIRKRLGIEKSDFVYLFIGRLVRDKGVEELVAAYQKIFINCKNTHLILLGNYYQNLDPISQDIINIIDSNPTIHYLGQKKDIRPYLSLSDIFVLPSYREGLSTVLVEAGAMSKPSITSNVTGCNDIVEDKKNGLLIKARDIDSLYDAMRFTYEHPEQNKIMGKAARLIITERYDQKIVWKNYLEEYKQIAKRLNNV